MKAVLSLRAYALMAGRDARAPGLERRIHVNAAVVLLRMKDEVNAVEGFLSSLTKKKAAHSNGCAAFFLLRARGVVTWLP
jgi:hypothetical protein